MPIKYLLRLSRTIYTKINKTSFETIKTVTHSSKQDYAFFLLLSFSNILSERLRDTIRDTPFTFKTNKYKVSKPWNATKTNVYALQPKILKALIVFFRNKST